MIKYILKNKLDNTMAVWNVISENSESISPFNGNSEKMTAMDVKIFTEMQTSNCAKQLFGNYKEYIIENVTKLTEEKLNLAKLAGIDLGDYTKFFADENRDNPTDPSSYAPVETIKFKEPKEILDNLEFHNGDDLEYQKFATGADVAEDTKIPVPDSIKSDIDKRISELQKSIEKYDNNGFDEHSAKGKTIDALDKIKKWLDDGSLEAIKNAQILYGTLATQYQVLIPPRVIDFIHTALNPYSKDDNIVKLNHAERSQTNK